MPGVAVNLNHQAIDRMLRDPSGPVGQMLQRRASRVLATVAGRAHAVWYEPSQSAVTYPTRLGLEVRVNLHHTRPHLIEPRTARVLRFTSHGVTVFARRVNHPGSKPPAHYLLEALPHAL